MMTVQTDPLLLEFARSHPEELSAELTTANLAEISEFVGSLPADVAATVSTRLPSWLLTGLLGTLDPEAVSHMLIAASSDDAIALVAHLHESHYPRILDACPLESKRRIRQLFDFPSHSLASLATTRFIRVPESKTCGDFYRQLAYSADTRPRPVLVVDQKGKYLGMLPLQAALAHKNRMRTVVEVASKVEPLSGMTSAETALGSRLWTRFTELPVVDSRHRLLGVVSRASLQRVAGEDSAAEFGTERLFSELAVGYFNTCSKLLESILGKSR